MPVWPATLPTDAQYGWSETPGDSLVRTQTDAGPAKLRRRFTSTPSAFSFQFVMTKAQATRLIQFYENASDAAIAGTRSEEHTSELQSQSTSSYAVFCLKKKKKKNT